LAAVTELLLFGLGVGLIAIEIFVLPGFGIAGISGVILIFVSLMLSMQDFNVPQAPWQWDMLQQNFILVTLSITVGVIVLVIIARLLPYSPYLSRLILRMAETQETGFTTAQTNLTVMVGKKGVALTSLRPSGKIRLDGEPFDAVTEGEFIEKDAPIEIVQIEGNRIVVTKAGSG
jgi:membrane-bound serine protease (ClpP class)